MTPFSLRRRLLGWLLLAAAILGLFAMIDTWREALLTAQGLSDRVLGGSALAIAERVALDQSGGLQVDIPYSALEMLTSTAQDQVFYRVDAPEGQFLTGYDSLTIIPAATGSAGASDTVFADGIIGDVPVRIATLRRQVSDGLQSIPFAVTVAESTRARTELARAILIRSALRLLVLAAAAAVVVWLVVTLALAPLNRLGDTIAQRSPDDLRPLRGRTPQEVQGLVEAINGFMERLNLALTGLRNFTGNASHQLRTPLATVRTQLAIATRSDDPGQMRSATQKADIALVRAEHVLAQLLVLARLDAAPGSAPLVPTDIAAVARDMTAEMVPAASQRGIDLGFEGAGTALVATEPILFREMLQNVVDNALAYAGPGAVVTVRLLTIGPDTLLEIEDNGPGLTREQIDAFHAGRRDRRLTPTKWETGSGYGFGLAIVREIAALLQARIEIATPALGHGLMVRISFLAT